jgi:hypothetical protein
MRDLSETQARVIRELLVNRPGSDRLKWATAGVPRSTFQLVRNHAFAVGWVMRRYIPDPGSVGVDRVRVEVVQPFAEKRAELLSQLARRKEVVVLWDSPGIILAVSFEHTQKREGGPTDAESGWSRRWVIESSLASSEVVAYFDYEGAWSRWALGEAPGSYPRGLPWPQKGPNSRSARFRAEDLAELVRRPTSGIEDEDGGSWSLAGGLPRRLQGLINHGQAIPWTIPDLAKIPRLPQRELAFIVLMSGRWAADCLGKQLFQELVGRSRATPFLYAYDANRVVMGLLAPAPATLTEGRTPMAAVLGRFLREIEVIREPIGSIAPVVNHRYDRLVGHEPR